METSVTKPVNRIDIGKALKLRHKHGLNDTEIGKSFGVTRQAVRKALLPLKNLFNDSEATQYIKDNYSDCLDKLNGQMLLQMVSPSRLKDKKLTLNQLAFAQSSIDRQLRLEAGKPDSITAHAVAVKDLEELKGKALALVSQLRAGKGEERRE